MSSLFGGSTSKLFNIQSQTQNSLEALQSQAYEDQAKLQDAQAQYATEDAQNAARQTARNADQVAGAQAVAFLNSGVTLQGSPIDLVDSTRRQAREEVDAILNRGVAASDLYRRSAAITRNSGRAAALGQHYDLSSQQLAYRMAENRAFGSGAYNLLSSVGGIAARPFAAKLGTQITGSSFWKNLFGP